MELVVLSLSSKSQAWVYEFQMVLNERGNLSRFWRYILKIYQIFLFYSGIVFLIGF